MEYIDSHIKVSKYQSTYDWWVFANAANIANLDFIKVLPYLQGITVILPGVIGRRL